MDQGPTVRMPNQLLPNHDDARSSCLCSLPHRTAWIRIPPCAAWPCARCAPCGWPTSWSTWWVGGGWLRRLRRLEGWSVGWLVGCQETRPSHPKPHLPLAVAQVAPVTQGLEDRHPYVRRTAVMGVLKIQHIDANVVAHTGGQAVAGWAPPTARHPGSSNEHKDA